MTSFGRDLVAVDRERADPRAGAVGLIVLALFGVAVAVVGTVALAAAIGALVLLATDPPDADESWASTLLVPAVGGAVATLAAVAVGDRPFVAAVVAGIVAVVAFLRAGNSAKGGVRSLVVTLWVIVALSLHDADSGPWAFAAAFAVGAAVGIAVTLAKRRAEAPVVEEVEPSEVEPTEVEPSEIVRFALLRGVGLAVAVYVGVRWYPEHPSWVAIAALVVMRPPTRQAFVVGLQRAVGTGVGVVIAVAVAEAIGDNRSGLVILFLFTAFLMMAVREVNYALFAMVVTALIVYSQRILGADAAESGRDRLTETLLGVAIAFVVLGVAHVSNRTRRSTV